MINQAFRQRSNISLDLGNKLILEALRKERIFMKTFYEKNSSALYINVVTLDIISDQTFAMIEAICIPVICADLSDQNNQHLSTQYPHLTGFKLAHKILIGSDYFYSFIFDEVLKTTLTSPLLSIPYFVGFYPDVLTISLPSTLIVCIFYGFIRKHYQKIFL